MISFNVSKEQNDLIVKIAHRADLEIFKPRDIDQSVMDTVMDLSATIAQGCPLKLDDLLAADAVNFAHDVAGIRRHIDRKTGLLGDCFLPRYFDSVAAQKTTAR